MTLPLCLRHPHIPYGKPITRCDHRRTYCRADISNSTDGLYNGLTVFSATTKEKSKLHGTVSVKNNRERVARELSGKRNKER